VQHSDRAVKQTLLTVSNILIERLDVTAQAGQLFEVALNVLAADDSLAQEVCKELGNASCIALCASFELYYPTLVLLNMGIFTCHLN
jgi:hypothetical protein